MKASKIVLFIVALLISFTVVANAAEFWASKKSNKYHYPDCKWAQRIKPENLIVFNTAEAIRAGYIPCKVCRPPFISRSYNNPTEYSLTRLMYQEKAWRFYEDRSNKAIHY